MSNNDIGIVVNRVLLTLLTYASYHPLVMPSSVDFIPKVTMNPTVEQVTIDELFIVILNTPYISIRSCFSQVHILIF